MNAAGHIDVYSKSGINMHTEGDYNVHAKGSINMQAEIGVNIKSSGGDGIKLETNEFIVSGLSFYRVYLFIPHPLLLFNTLLFIIPFNILMHTALGYQFAMWMNIISVILCSGFWIHMRMIFFEQKYPSIINNGTIIKRRINT